MKIVLISYCILPPDRSLCSEDLCPPLRIRIFLYSFLPSCLYFLSSHVFSSGINCMSWKATDGLCQGTLVLAANLELFGLRFCTCSVGFETL